MTAPDVPVVPIVPPFAEPGTSTTPFSVGGEFSFPADDARAVAARIEVGNLPAGAIRLVDGRVVLPNGEFAITGTVANPFSAEPIRLPDGEVIHASPRDHLQFLESDVRRQLHGDPTFVPLSHQFPNTPAGDAAFADALMAGHDELERLLGLAENETGYAQKQAVTDLRKLLNRPKRRGT